TVAKTTRLAVPFGQSLEFFWIDQYTRISRVSAVSPDKETLQKIAQLPELEFLEVFGGSYDSTDLEQALSNPNFRSLRIADRPLDDQFIKRIGTAKQLRALSFAGTNISNDGLTAIGPMPCLRFLDLQNTRLDKPGSARCLSNVRTLICPIPMSRHLELDGLTLLSRLEIRHSSNLLTARPSRDTTCSVKIADLPHLETLYVDRDQIFDVSLTNVPKLKTLDLANPDSASGISPAARVVDSPMMRSLRIESAPLLKILKLDGVTLEQLSTGPMDSLELNLTPNQVVNGLPSAALTSMNSITTIRTLNVNGVPQPVTVTQLWPNGKSVAASTNTNPSLVQKHFDSIVECTGLSKLDMGVHLIENLDLSRLAASQSLRSLKLIDRQLTEKQVEQLSQIPNLQLLEMPQCRVSAAVFEQLATRLPNISEIQCIIANPYMLKLENVPHLKRIFGPTDINVGRWQQYRELRLLNLPKFSESIQLMSPINQLHMENLPNIPALVIHHPIPPNCILQGLDSLLAFAGGGANLDDEILRDLLQCKKLKRLSIVYASASSETLKLVGQLQDLEHLVLTGCHVDDAVVQHLSQLKHLKTLRLEETRISASSLTALKNIPALERLSISDTPAANSDLSQLKALKSLTRLDIAGSKSATGLAAALSALPKLQLVDLSRSVLSDEFLSEWLQSSNLKQMAVSVRDSQFNEQAFIQSLGKKKIQFAVEGTELSADAWLLLESRSQLLGLVGRIDEFPPSLDSGIPLLQSGRPARFAISNAMEAELNLSNFRK
ncbi:MAG: hypothetical protein ABL921_25700, partial [Pirellula sp.]